MVTNEAEFTIP